MQNKLWLCWIKVTFYEILIDINARWCINAFQVLTATESIGKVQLKGSLTAESVRLFQCANDDVVPSAMSELHILTLRHQIKNLGQVLHSSSCNAAAPKLKLL